MPSSQSQIESKLLFLVNVPVVVPVVVLISLFVPSSDVPISFSFPYAFGPAAGLRGYEPTGSS